jgi:hypothetical protein
MKDVTLTQVIPKQPHSLLFRRPQCREGTAQSPGTINKLLVCTLHRARGRIRTLRQVAHTLLHQTQGNSTQPTSPHQAQYHRKFHQQIMARMSIHSRRELAGQMKM